MTELIGSWWLMPLIMTGLVGILCPATGALLITQKRLLQANLISHSVLPGLALAIAIGLDPALGGVISGLIGALAAERLALKRNENNEAVINTVLAGSLGFGVLIIPLLGIKVDLESILFGDLLTISTMDIARIGIALILLIVIIKKYYQQLVYLGLDAEGADASGMNIYVLRLILGLVTAVVIVSSMSAVGVILVISLLSAPALLGLNQANSLKEAMIRSSFIGLLLSLSGFIFAVTLNLSPGPLIGVLCILCLTYERRKLNNY